MRTTVTLGDDVVAEIERLKREENLGFSKALNQLARRGMLQTAANPSNYTLPTFNLGEALVDVTSTGDALAYLDEADWKERDS